MDNTNRIIDDEDETPEANLLEIEDWSEQIAQELAEEEGITLSKEHWNVINFLRDHYQRCGPCPNGRAVLHLIEDSFPQLADKKHLYHLFPRGPVVQAYKIAGLPLPAYSKDMAFGSVM